MYGLEQEAIGAPHRDPRRTSAPSAQQPLVSVIIPVRNDAKRLEVCLRSLGMQDYPSDRIEIVVVDNGSTDESSRVARSHGAKVLHCPHLRVGALRNRGVEAAHGEVLAFVDSDHEVPVQWIGRAVQELLATINALVVGSPCLAPRHGTWVQRSWELHRLRRHDRHPVGWLGAGNMFLRRHDFLQVGGFREDLVAAEDVDLCVRLSRSPGQIIYDLRLANIHHGEPATLWRFFWKEYWRGSSGLRAFLTQGMPVRELPSLLYPAYHLVAVLGLLLAALCGVIWRSPIYVAIAILVALWPSLMLAAKTCWQVKRPGQFLPLTVLYLTFGLSRAAALFKR